MRQRLESLDALRGLTVIGMVAVNGADVGAAAGFPAFPLMLHADWAGLTLADLVFPCFIFMVGVSVALASPGAPTPGGVGRIWMRGAKLFALGLLLNVWFHGFDEPVRIMGVLQRIALVYVGAALVHRWIGNRVLGPLIAVLLVGYGFLLTFNVPDAGAPNLLVPGRDFASWLDRTLLGAHVYMTAAPLPFDPEGLLSTVPALAQGLIGVMAGRRLRDGGSVAGYLVAAIAMLVAGTALAQVQPTVKALWTPAFVLVTTGVALFLLASLHRMLDLQGRRPFGVGFARDFGVNAITGYVWHSFLLGPVAYSAAAATLFRFGQSVLPDRAAALLPVLLLLVLTWAPLFIMRRKGWIVKI